MKLKELKAKTREKCLKEWKTKRMIDHSKRADETKISYPEILAFERGFNMAWNKKPTRIMLDAQATFAYIKGVIGK